MLPDIASSMSASVGCGLLGEQRRGGHDLARLAIAALRHLAVEPGLLDLGAGRRRADRLDGRDLATCRRCRSAVMQERIGAPSICTVQAPHSAMPQPNLVPVMPSTSRSTQSSGVSPSTSTLCVLPLTLMVKAMTSSPLRVEERSACPALQCTCVPDAPPSRWGRHETPFLNRSTEVRPHASVTATSMLPRVAFEYGHF